MPLPFAFSVQRQLSEGLPGEVAEPPRFEGMMLQAPANVSTEPLRGTGDRAFFPPVPGRTLEALVADSKPGEVSVPSNLSPNIRLAGETLELSPALRAPSSPLPQPADELSSQLEQFRNDVFGIAMSVSALKDRLDRLEQRVPPGAQFQNAIATMQGQIEAWLESHLNSAVEHCLRRIMAASPSSSAES